MQGIDGITGHARATGHRRTRLAILALPAFVLTSLALLTACTADPEEKAPLCPQAYLRPDAATLTRYNGRGHDLTDLVLNVRLVDVKGACIGQLGKSLVKSHAHVVMLVSRGPAAQGRDVDIQYNVALTHKGKLERHEPHTQHITFPPNVDTVQVTGDEVEFDLQTKRGVGGQDYSIYFVLQLTPAELAANRAALTAGR